MKEHINLFVVKVLINDSMNVHEVLNYGVTERQSRFDLLTSIMTICHFEAELADTIDTISSLLIVFMKNAEGVIFPVELREDKHSELRVPEVLIGRENVHPMNAELVAVFRGDSVVKLVIYLDLLRLSFR